MSSKRNYCLSFMRKKIDKGVSGGWENRSGNKSALSSNVKHTDGLEGRAH